MPAWIVRPAPGKSLSDGVLVDAIIVARLLGLKLLRLNARVELVPTDFGAGRPASPRPPVRPPALDGKASVRPVPPAPAATGGTLDEAVTLLQRAAQTMREAKRADTRPASGPG